MSDWWSAHSSEPGPAASRTQHNLGLTPQGSVDTHVGTQSRVSSISSTRPRQNLAKVPWLGRPGGGCGHDEFVLDGGQPAERYLSRASVVGPLDPGDDRDTQLFAGGPGAPVEDVLLQQAEEGLHGGVVAGGTDAAHRADHGVTVQAWTNLREQN